MEIHLPRIIKPLAKATLHTSNRAYRIADKGFTNLAKWVATDHTGISRAIHDMPRMGFFATCKHILFCFFVTVIGVLLSGMLIFLLITFGIPLFIQLLLI